MFELEKGLSTINYNFPDGEDGSDSGNDSSDSSDTGGGG